MRFAAWAILGGVVGGGLLSWWARVSPVMGAFAQITFVAAGVLFGLQLARDTRRIERERHEFERLRLECEQAHIDFLRSFQEHVRLVGDKMLSIQEADLLRRQVDELAPDSWLQ